MAFCSHERTDELQKVTLTGIIPLNRKLGAGSFGIVFTVKYRGVVCAAKKIHPVLLTYARPVERKRLEENFIKECTVCSKVRHPNIVQFYGVYYDSSDEYSPSLPIMVMELMDTTLTDFIEKNASKIAFHQKISILYDVCVGVRYLHSHNPPILHRDLSSNNVMLTSQLVAKIGDLGVAKMVPRKAKQKLTRVPGTTDFMPPEALLVDSDDNPVYGTPLDVFSLGGIALHLLSEEWPSPSAFKLRDANTKMMLVVSEVDRRRQYLDKMTGKAAELRMMVEQCLNYDPDERPPIQEVSANIEQLKCSLISMGAALSFCGSNCPRLVISRSDVESGLMSRSARAAVSEIDQKKELISSTIEQAHLKVLRSASTAKDENLGCSTSLIELEWYGTKYSRKFGSLLSYETFSTSDEQLQMKYKAAVVQDANCFSQQRLIQHIGWTVNHTDINNYTVKQVEQILQNTKIDSRHLVNLKHENIIKFYGIFYEDNKLPVLIMEPIQCDLHEFLDQSISWSNAFTILQGISEGLSYLHDDNNMIHRNICTRSIVITGTVKAPVAKLTSFELAIVLPHDATAQEEIHLKSSDMFCFGQVLVNIIQCTEHTEKKLHSLFESMHEFAVECMSLINRPTSGKILNAIVKYRCQYESGGDDGLDGSSHDHSTGLLKRLRKENEQLKNQVAQTKALELKLMEIEEKNFKLTNAFTTMDSRSPLKISEDYRYIQQHYRAAAAQAHRKMHSKCSPVPPFHEHTMIAYHKAKELILVASTQYIKKSLFDLQHQPDESHNVMENVVTDLRGVQLMMNELHDDHNLTVDSIDTIEKTLIEAYKDHINQQDSVPTEVKDYYSRLAKLTWNAVAKAIPMVLSTEAKYYDATVHELNDEPEDGIDPSATYMVEYIYPILFTSNHHPREVALKGKVKFLFHSKHLQSYYIYFS